MDAGPWGLVHGELAALGSSGDLYVVAAAAVALLLVLVAVVGARKRVAHAARRLLLPGLLLAAAGLLYLGYRELGGGAAALALTPRATLPVSAGTILLTVAAVYAVAPTNRRRRDGWMGRLAERHARRERRASSTLLWGATSSPSLNLVSPLTRTPETEPAAFSTRALRDEVTSEQTLLRVLSYVVIAEFGVFSSRTLPAPTVEVGLAFGGVFLALAFLFIRTSYASTVRGVGHLLVALLFGFLLSVVLGHYWSDLPVPTLLSVAYFQTSALVAVVTGIAVSLFMGSRG